MLFDMLILFVVVVIISFILTMFLIWEKPLLSVAFIMVGMIFSVLSTYGFWDVEFFYTSINTTTGGTDALIYSTTEYGNPYSFIFFFMFFVFFMLLFVAAFKSMSDEAEKFKMG